MLKVIPTIAAIASAGAITNATMGMGLVPFLTEPSDWRSKSTASDNSWEISLRELVSTNMGMDMSTYKSGKLAFGKRANPLLDAVKMNLKAHGMEAAMTLVAAKVAPKILNKTGVPRTVNRLLKNSGLGSIIQL
jgi:hypothetical protein